MWIGRPSHPTAARQRGAITCSTVSRVERSEPELSEVNWGPARDGLRCSHYAATRPASGCATRRSPPDEPRASCRELTQLPSSRSAIFRYSSIFDFVPRTSRRRAPPALLRLRAHLTRRHRIQLPGSAALSPHSALSLSLRSIARTTEVKAIDINQTLRLYSLYSMGSRETLYAILTSIEPEVDRARGGERADVVPDAARYMQNVGL